MEISDLVLRRLAAIETQLHVITERLGERLWTMDMVAQEFRVSKRTVYRRVKDGLLMPIPAPGHPRFTAEEVERARCDRVFEQRHRK